MDQQFMAQYIVWHHLPAALALPQVDGGGAARDHDVLRCQREFKDERTTSQCEVNGFSGKPTNTNSKSMRYQ